MTLPDELTTELDDLLGGGDVPMEVVDERVRARFGDDVIVWEGDAATFQYTYVSASAEHALGFARSRWVGEPTFWADVVVHEHDRDEAVSYCALATARKQHHVFDYRACAQDGRVVWFRDYVKVLLGPRQVPQRLRGFMIDVSARYRDLGSYAKHQAPSRASLDALIA